MARDEGAGGIPVKTDAIHATVRGVIGAMAMTGMRQLTYDLGLMRTTPPEMIAKHARGLKKIPKRRRTAVVVLLHWAVGAQGGFMYGLLPESVRRTRWSGPAFGIAIWAGFDAAIGPLLDVKKGDWPNARERATLIADHVLYGFVLSETRAQPRE
jgi:hypothetical protein